MYQWGQGGTKEAEEVGEEKLPRYKDGAYHQGCLCNKLVLGGPERSARPTGSQMEPEEHIGGERCTQQTGLKNRRGAMNRLQ